jgi:2-(1,2-epoxy-1,2-dihydrophenyl)acetyl-CoA isomerase
MSSVVVGDDGAVRLITLSRPERLNALDDASRPRPALRTRGRGADDAGVRAIVITGAGRAFCTGQDVTASEELEDAHATVRETYNPLSKAIRTMGEPVVAAINGPAVGAGPGLALSRDLRVMARSAYLACSFSTVGLVPDTGTTVALLRGLGHSHVFAATASGRRIGAPEAVDARLVNEAVEDGEVLDRALLEIGVSVRVGLEDNFYLPSGEMARSNGSSSTPLAGRSRRRAGAPRRSRKRVSYSACAGPPDLRRASA